MDLFATRAPWYVAGPLLGLTIVALLWATNKPFGALGGYIELEEWARRKLPGPSWRVFFLLGIIVGGFLSSVVAGGPVLTFAYGSFDVWLGQSLLVKVLILFAAGALIGFGGRMAGGCTSGHGLCGVSLASPASLVSTLTFMAVAIAATQALRLLRVFQ